MESLRKVSRGLSERELAFVGDNAEKMNDIEKPKSDNNVRRNSQRHDRTENVKFDAIEVENSNDTAQVKRKLVNSKYLKGSKENSTVEYNGLIKEINEARNDKTQMNGALNTPYFNMTDKDPVYEDIIKDDANLRHSKSRYSKNTEKALRDMTNDAGNESDEKVRNSEYFHGTNAIANENLGELTKQNDAQKRKNKRSKKSKPKTVSLKQFGLDHEITINYIPPLKCPTSQQTFRMDRWKRRIIARKHSAMNTKADNAAGDPESENDKEGKHRINVNKVQRGTNNDSWTYLNDLEATSLALKQTNDYGTEQKGQEDALSENDPNIENMEKVLEVGNNTETEEETLPDPRKPVYDAYNSSTGMILLNNRDIKKSRLWRINLSRNMNRGNLINPERHIHNTSPRTVSHSRCLSNSLEKFESSIKLDLSFPDRPLSENIGDRLHEARMSVNPRRHRACAVTTKESLASLDTSGSTIKDDTSSPKNKWLRIYSKPHERREPTKIKKNKPNFRDMIKSPAWSSSNTTTLHNKKTKGM